MDAYSLSLLLGALGLLAMSLGGLTHQLHAKSSAGADGHAHDHADPSWLAAPRALHRGLGRGSARSLRGTSAKAATGGNGVLQLFVALLSPRVLFSVLLGFGTVGLLLHAVIGGWLRFVIAIAGGWAFERFFVHRVQEFALRFASKPALTLEGAILDEAIAVTAFDANGDGIVRLELDGQVVQLLASLRPADRSLGVRVRAGDRLHIEDIDSARNRCTVSLQ
jgi:hypothetical protein